MYASNYTILSELMEMFTAHGAAAVCWLWKIIICK